MSCGPPAAAIPKNWQWQKVRSATAAALLLRLLRRLWRPWSRRCACAAASAAGWVTGIPQEPVSALDTLATCCAHQKKALEETLRLRGEERSWGGQ